MRNKEIARLASCATIQTIHGDADGTQQRNLDFTPFAMDLHAYCRERKFPPAEQLARKAAELNDEAFAFGIWQASETMRAGFEVFRAVALALEPFREPDVPATNPAEKSDSETMPEIKDKKDEAGQEKTKLEKASGNSSKAAKAKTSSKT